MNNQQTVTPKVSPQKAISNYCKGCCYDPADVGTWRQQVERCSVTQCELWQHRPITKETRELQKQKELDSMTPEQRQAHELKVQASAIRMDKARKARG